VLVFCLGGCGGGRSEKTPFSKFGFGIISAVKNGVAFGTGLETAIAKRFRELDGFVWKQSALGFFFLLFFGILIVLTRKIQGKKGGLRI